MYVFCNISFCKKKRRTKKERRNEFVIKNCIVNDEFINIIETQELLLQRTLQIFQHKEISYQIAHPLSVSTKIVEQYVPYRHLVGGQIVPLSQTRDFSLVKFKLTREKKQETCSKAITKAHCESLKKKPYNNFHKIGNKIYYKKYRINISLSVLILFIYKLRQHKICEQFFENFVCSTFVILKIDFPVK